jgi:Resolvase, N terminal domain
MTETKRAALYARVSTAEQTAENQLLEMRRYCQARGWTLTEYIDAAVSGAKERRPALDQMMADAKRRRFDVLVVWRLDRLGRNLKHLILLLERCRSSGSRLSASVKASTRRRPPGSCRCISLARSHSSSETASGNASAPVWRAFEHKGNDWGGVDNASPQATWSESTGYPFGMQRRRSACRPRGSTPSGNGCLENPPGRGLTILRKTPSPGSTTKEWVPSAPRV